MKQESLYWIITIRCHLGGKLWKREEKKSGNVKEEEERGNKRKKGERK